MCILSAMTSILTWFERCWNTGSWFQNLTLGILQLPFLFHVGYTHDWNSHALSQSFLMTCYGGICDMGWKISALMRNQSAILLYVVTSQLSLIGWMNLRSGLERNQPQRRFFLPLFVLFLKPLWCCCVSFHRKPKESELRYRLTANNLMRMPKMYIFSCEVQNDLPVWALSSECWETLVLLPVL